MKTEKEIREYIQLKLNKFHSLELSYRSTVYDLQEFCKELQNEALSQHDVIKNEVAVCDKCLGRGSHVIYDTCIECKKCNGNGTQTDL